jgi:uncharacterized protein DUF3108
MLLPLVSAALLTLSRTDSGAIRASAEDSLRCAPGERRIEITAAADPRPGYASNEQLQYSAYYGKLRVGSGEMRLVGRDTVRGRSAWRAMFIIDGGIPGAHLHDTTITWFDSVTFNSMRFVQNVHDPGYHANRDTHIFPEDRTYRTKDGEIHPSVPDPLDDMSLVYLVRTLPLEPGQCYVLSRYFKPESNPVVVHVVRRDTVDVPAGRFPAILLRPEIKTNGIFSQNGHAELWLADDSARTVLQLKTSLKFGSISLKLRRIGRDQ